MSSTDLVEQRREAYNEHFQEGDHIEFDMFCDDNDIEGDTQEEKISEVKRRFSYEVDFSVSGVLGVVVPDQHKKVTRFRRGVKSAAVVSQQHQMVDQELA